MIGYTPQSWAVVSRTINGGLLLLDIQHLGGTQKSPRGVVSATLMEFLGCVIGFK